MDESDIDELFAQTLQGDYEDEAAWQAVSALRASGTRRVFERAARWTESIDPMVRARGADILAQLGMTPQHPSHAFPHESYEVLLGLVQREHDPQPLNAAITALGHIGDARAVPVIAPFHTHASQEVRFAVAWTLGCLHEHPLSVRTLLTLMEDLHAPVRDWATFAIGALSDQDDPEVRRALWARLDDECVDVREEALVGLARRHEMRIVPHLISALEQAPVSMCIIEAACALLGLEEDKAEWSLQDYIQALRELI